MQDPTFIGSLVIGLGVILGGPVALLTVIQKWKDLQDRKEPVSVSSPVGVSIRQDLSTKAELLELEKRLDAKIDQIRDERREDMTRVHQRLDAQASAVAELKGLIQAIHADLARLQDYHVSGTARKPAGTRGTARG